MKKNLLLIFILVLFPINVFATNASTPVSNNLTYDQCLSFQDSRISTSGSGYFGHCKQATCYTGKWEQSYYISRNLVYCSNGNGNPYIQIINDGCKQYQGTCTPSVSASKYCSVVTYYDCAKTSNGNVYVAQTTKTTNKTITTTRKTSTTNRNKTTNKSSTTSSTTTTTTTTTPTTTPNLDNNNYLSSIKLSEGNINFDKETLVYNIEVNSDVNYIEVEAKAESSKAKVEIINNKDINEDKPITITVTAEDESQRIYLINVIKKEEEPVLSSNNLIKNIYIENYKLKFKSTKNNYTLKIKEDIKNLNIKVELEDEKASYILTGNDNLKSGSKINIVVTAENGSENVYTIKIKKKNNSLLAIIIIIILGIACVVGFKLIRNLLPAKKDDKYGYE